MCGYFLNLGDAQMSLALETAFYGVLRTGELPRAPQAHRVVGLGRGSGTGHEPQDHDDADQARGGAEALSRHRKERAFGWRHFFLWNKKREHEQQAKHGDQARRPLLQMCAQHVSVSSKLDCAVLSLGFTKTSQRTGAADSVTIRLESLCRKLSAWKSTWQGVWVTMHIHILLSRYGSYRIYVNYNIYVL